MPSSMIIALICGGLLLIVCVGFVVQSMERQQQEKKRVESALKQRARNFRQMLEGFPKGFLGKDLQILVCTCLQDVYEQLVQLNNKEPEYKKQLDSVNEHLQKLNKTQVDQRHTPLSDPKQIKEVQKLLNTLFNFIIRLRKTGKVNQAQAQNYSRQIKRLVTRTSVDAITDAMKTALAQNKPKLAVHYLHMAIDKMNQQNADGSFTQNIAAMQEQIEQLEKTLEERKQKAEEQISEQWDDVEQDDDSWKKKAIYD